MISSFIIEKIDVIVVSHKHFKSLVRLITEV